MTPLGRLSFGFRGIVGNPSFVSCNNRVQKIITFKFIPLQKLFGGRCSIQFVLLCQLFWDPSCTQFMKSESFCDCFVQQRSGDLWKHHRKFIQSQSAVATNSFLNFFNKRICQNRRSSTPLLVVHISTTVFKFTIPFKHTRTIHSFFAINR